MDAELRLLLYAVAFGSGYSLYSIVRRRIARTLRIHAAVLAALLVASCAALAHPAVRAAIAVPTIVAFGALALGPSLLILCGRALARRRYFGLASASVRSGATLLGLPASIASESRLYGALAASERGDTDVARERLLALVAAGGLASAHGGVTLAEALPLAGARRWDEALRVLDERPSSATAVLAIEVRAAAESGDLRRALRAHARLEARGDAGVATSTACRGLLAAAGRVEFLAEAERRRAPVMSGPRGTADLAIARAYEARGAVESARDRYTRATRSGRGAIARDARSGLDRLDAGTPLEVTLDEEELDDILRVEERARVAEGRAPTRAKTPVVTVVVSVVTVLVSAMLFLARGDDAFTLLAAGALSEPLVRADGEWWRLFSAMLLHGGWLHLFLNLSCIAVVGAIFEWRAGAAATLVVYLGSGFLGSLASVYLNGTQIGVGASGGAMGLIAALLVLVTLRPALFTPLERKRWQSTLWAGILGTAAIGIAEAEYIDNAAHAVGALGGALLGAIVLPSAAVHAGAARLRRAGMRLAAALLTGLALAACVEARRGFEAWDGWQDVSARGARVTLPGWLRVTPTADGGMVAQRLPAEIAILIGSSPAVAIRPATLLDEGSALRALFDAALAAGAVTDTVDDDFELRPRSDAEAESLGLDWHAGVRFVVVRNGAAFALTRLPVGPEADDAYGPVLRDLRKSLAPVP